MFREMRRRKQALDHEACACILATEKRGALAVNGDDGYPYAIPMDFFYDEDANALYLHSAAAGHKVDAINRDNKVCFTTWRQGACADDGWSYYCDSVVAFGHARIVTDESERVACTKKLGLKYYPTEAEVDTEIERDLSRMLLICIDVVHMTGKHVHER